MANKISESKNPQKVAKKVPSSSKNKAKVSKSKSSQKKSSKELLKVKKVVTGKQTKVSVKKTTKKATTKGKISGYGKGSVKGVLSVEEVNKQANRLANKKLTKESLEKLTKDSPLITIEALCAGYGEMEILHGIDLVLSKGKSLCLIGPNGAGKSTVLHSIFGFTNIFSGKITMEGQDITALKSDEKLSLASISYIMQNNSVFPNMTVEENLYMGGFSIPDKLKVAEQVERVLQKYDRLRVRSNKPAKILSGGERRLLEISRALVTQPEILLVDEPSIGLEPKYIDMVFEILKDLQHNEKKTIIMVEQNAKKGLEFADIGYVMVDGSIVLAESGKNILKNKEVGKLFLGG